MDAIKSTVGRKIPDTIQKNLASLAKTHLKEEGFDLTGDPREILQIIDTFALKMHNDLETILTSEKSDEIIQGAAIEMASLIVELVKIDKKCVALWFYDQKTFGENNFPLLINDNYVIFPMGWVIKRILDGKAESVVSKYNQTVESKF